MSKELIEKLKKGLNNKHLSDAQKKSIKAKIESLEKLEKKSEKAKLAKTDSIKKWYQNKFPNDDLGKKINPSITFDELKKDIPKVYDKLNVYDSLARERVFNELANRMGVTYKSVYNEWLNDTKDSSKKEVKAKPAKKEEVSTAVKKELKRHAKGRDKDDIHRDKSRTALKGGKRISANGNVYYERRPNRSDVNPRKRFEDGGNVDSDTKYIVVDEKILAATIPNRFNNTKGTDEAEVIAVAPSEIGFTKLGDVFFLKNKNVRPATSADFDKYKVEEPKSSKKEASYRISIGYDHKNNYELYQVVGIDNDYVGEYHKDKKDAEAELKDMEGVKFEDGGNVSAINWQNFTLNELSDYIKNEYSSDIQLNTFSPLKEVKTNSGTELKQDDFISIGKISKKDKDESLSIGYAKQIEATSGSENVYLNIVVYRNDSDKPFMLSIYTKEDKKGIKELANEIIEKFEDGGNIEPTEFEVAADENVEKMAKGGSIATCPVGTKIQTIIFSKEFYNKVRAVKWLNKHGYKGTIGDDKSTTVRFRQVSPDKFEDDTFRTIELTKGVKAVIGCPKKKMAKGGSVDSKLTLREVKGLDGEEIDGDLYKKILRSGVIRNVSTKGMKENGLNRYEVLLNDKSSIYLYMK